MLLLTFNLITGKYKAVPKSYLYKTVSHREFTIDNDSTEWIIAHNLNTDKLIISAYTSNGKLIPTSNFQIVDSNTVKINVSDPSTGVVKIISDF